MKTLFALIGLCAALVFAGCTSTSTSSSAAPTVKQETAAEIVNDSITIILIPVLAHNPDYIPAVHALGSALNTFSGDTLTPGDIAILVTRAAAYSPNMTNEDRQIIAGVINEAWKKYTKKYQVTANASIRPDVKLFLKAVGDALTDATAAITPVPAA